MLLMVWMPALKPCAAASGVSVNSRRARKSPKLRPLDDVRDVHVPICLIHVRNDWLISHKHSIALYEAANEPKELHVIDIPGNYHADRIFRVASDSIEPVFLDFLDRYSTRVAADDD